MWQLTPVDDLAREMKGCCIKAKCLLKRVAFILQILYLTYFCDITGSVQKFLSYTQNCSSYMFRDTPD